MRNRTIVGGLVLSIPALIAAGVISLSFGSGSRVWVQGTSTARAYRCESRNVDGAVQAGGATLASLGSVSSARVSIPVSSLDCANGTMNGHMRNALKAPQAPTISFQTTEVAIDGTNARLTGQLSIAGQSRPVTINATVAEEEGALRVRGSKQIVMTEWGVRPPSLMLGAMRVNPNVTVGFDVLLRP